MTEKLKVRLLYAVSALAPVTVPANTSVGSTKLSLIAASATLCWVCQLAEVNVKTVGVIATSSTPAVQMVMVTSEVGAELRAINSVSPAPPSATAVDPPL